MVGESNEGTLKKGWLCPRCGKVNAPFVTQCTCTRAKWEITYPYFPQIMTSFPYGSKACDTCSVNPKNGGSGVCNCTLCEPAVTC